MCDGGWLLALLSAIPLSYLTSTHDKQWMVTKDHLSQVLTSVVTTAVNVIHWLRTCCLLVPWMRLRIGQRPSFFFRPVHQAQKRQFASSSQVINMPLPSHSGMCELSSPMSGASSLRS